jgi:hypothetical protein
MSSYNAIGGTIKNSLTMHTIIRSADDGEKTTSIQCKHTFIIEYHFTDETKVSAEYTNMNDATTRWFN